MKILVVTGGFYPGRNYGGIVTSRVNFCKALENDHEIFVLTTNHDFKTKEKYKNISDHWSLFGNSKVLYVDDKFFKNSKKLSDVLLDVKPDFIYMSGTITSLFQINFKIIKLANKMDIPCIVTPDGDLNSGAISAKSFKKKTVIKIAKILSIYRECYFHVTSDAELQNLIKLLNISKNNIFLLPNFVSTNCKINFHKKSTSLKLIYSARIHPHKNLLMLLESLAAISDFDIELDIFGNIEDNLYWNKCVSCINLMKQKNVQIKYRGQFNSLAIMDLYPNYDFMILPTKGENYCYSIEEALLSGCPVLISHGTTPWDFVDGQMGFCFENTKEELLKTIKKASSLTNNQYTEFQNNISNFVLKELNVEEQKTRFMATVNELLLKRKHTNG